VRDGRPDQITRTSAPVLYIDLQEKLNAMKKFFRARVLIWPLLLVAALFIGGIVAAFASGAMNAVAFSSIFGGNTVKENTEVVKFVVPEQQVVLASAHIEGIQKEGTDGKIFGLAIPASSRVTYLLYKFDAKLGIEGSEVKIDPVEGKKNAYRVSIPKFIFIGNSKPEFEDPIKSNDVLGWLAEEANQSKMTNSILGDRNAEKYVKNSNDVLTAQAKVFYTSIIQSVSPGAKIEFVFADGTDTSGDGK